MGSIWNNVKLSNELLDDTLNYYGTERNVDNTYQLRDGADGFRVIERDKNDNIINVYRTPVGTSYKEDNIYDGAVKTISEYQKHTRKIVSLRYSISIGILILVLISITIIIIGRGG